MPSFKYQFINSEHSTTSYTYDHYHSVSVSDANNYVTGKIPQYSKIGRIYLYARTKSSIPAKADAYWVLSNSSPYRSGYTIHSAKESVGNSYTNITANMPSNLYSDMNVNSGQLLTPYSRLAFTETASVLRKYQCSDVYAEWSYTLPTYTINLSANGGGTVSGGGTHEITQFNNVISSGGSWTFTATPAEGYRFVGWRRVGYTGYITYENNYTYTREQIWSNSTTENIEGVFEKISTGIYLKQNGSFTEAKNVYVKQSGAWVKTDKTIFDASKKYRII